MRRYEAEEKARKEYGDVRLVYDVKDNPYYNNDANYQKMVDALDAVGVWLNVADGRLTLSIYPEGYVRTKDRHAGRRTAIAIKNDDGKFGYYKYSDIVYMMQFKIDQQVADEIGMKIATYYRHKKKLKESAYYKSLDLNRLKDKEYLESVPGNFGF
jgi:hypothetical protein